MDVTSSLILDEVLGCSWWFLVVPLSVTELPSALPPSGDSDELRSFGSLDYWLRLRVPMAETLRLFKEKAVAASVAADDHAHALPRPDPGGGGCTNQLVVTVQRCGDLPCSPAHQPSPFVVYKFSHFPDCPTATVAECSQPRFDHVRCFTVTPGGSELDRYLRSERLHFYVFDFKGQRMDEYLGKAAVELLPLALGQEVSGEAPPLHSHSLTPSHSFSLPLSLSPSGLMSPPFSLSHSHIPSHSFSLSLSLSVSGLITPSRTHSLSPSGVMCTFSPHSLPLI